MTAYSSSLAYPIFLIDSESLMELTSMQSKMAGERIAVFAFSYDDDISPGEGIIVSELLGPDGRTFLAVVLDAPYKWKRRQHKILALSSNGAWLSRIFHRDDSEYPSHLAEVTICLLRRKKLHPSAKLREKDLLRLENAKIEAAFVIDQDAPAKHDFESLARYNHARRLIAWCRREFSLELRFDEESIARLDEAIDRAYPQRVPEEEVGRTVAPWADFLLEAVSRVMKGQVVDLPGNGPAVLARDGKGQDRIVETSAQIWNRLQYGRQYSLAAWFQSTKRILSSTP